MFYDQLKQLKIKERTVPRRKVYDRLFAGPKKKETKASHSMRPINVISLFKLYKTSQKFNHRIKFTDL